MQVEALYPQSEILGKVNLVQAVAEVCGDFALVVRNGFIICMYVCMYVCVGLCSSVRMYLH
jgi:hypothetical protein